jgi:hypothetical protein
MARKSAYSNVVEAMEMIENGCKTALDIIHKGHRIKINPANQTGADRVRNLYHRRRTAGLCIACGKKVTKKNPKTGKPYRMCPKHRKKLDGEADIGAEEKEELIEIIITQTSPEPKQTAILRRRAQQTVRCGSFAPVAEVAPKVARKIRKRNRKVRFMDTVELDRRIKKLLAWFRKSPKSTSGINHAYYMGNGVHTSGDMVRTIKRTIRGMKLRGIRLEQRGKCEVLVKTKGAKRNGALTPYNKFFKENYAAVRGHGLDHKQTITEIARLWKKRKAQA